MRLKIYLVLFLGFIPGAYSASLTVTDALGNPLSQAVVSIQKNGQPAGKFSQLVTMDQVDRQFKPHLISIYQGQSVIFPNSDNIRHHVYSFSEAKPFEIKLYSGTPTEPIRFDNPGIVVLGCNIHDSMIGYIYVAERNLTEHEAVYLSDSQGKVEVALEASEKLLIWHERLEKIESRQQFSLLNAGQGKPEQYKIVLDVKPLNKDNQNQGFKSKFK